MLNIYNCCCLCLKEDKNNGNNLIWCDSMQLCQNCYDEYNESDYKKQIMPINAIKKYRRKVEDLIQEIKSQEDFLIEEGYLGNEKETKK